MSRLRKGPSAALAALEGAGGCRVRPKGVGPFLRPFCGARDPAGAPLRVPAPVHTGRPGPGRVRALRVRAYTRGLARARAGRGGRARAGTCRYARAGMGGDVQVRAGGSDRAPTCLRGHTMTVPVARVTSYL